MSEARARLSLETHVHPPVRGGAGGTAAALLRLAVEAAGPAPPARVVVARVGAGGLPVAALLERARPDDRVVGVDGRRLGPGDGLPEAAAAPTLAAALEAAHRLAAGAPRLTRLFAVLGEPLDEDLDALLGAVAALAEARLGFDLFVDGPGVDLGALARLAAAAGGEVVAVGHEPARVGPALAARLEVLQAQRAPGLRLEVGFAPGVEPGALFRVEPSPALLGHFRLPAGERALRLDPGLLVPGRPTDLLLTLNVAARRLGTWRLAQVTVADDRGVWARAPVVQRITDDPAAARLVAAQVVAARDRVEPVAWLDDVAHALSDGDHRRVAGLLERLQRRLVELGRGPAVALVADLRQRFLRSGDIDGDDLDALRRLSLD